jgi:hypothetical protein
MEKKVDLNLLHCSDVGIGIFLQWPYFILLGAVSALTVSKFSLEIYSITILTDTKKCFFTCKK